MQAQSPGIPVVRVVHHQDLNKTILVALIVASTLLAGVLLFLLYFLILRRRNLNKSITNRNEGDIENASQLNPSLRRLNSLGLGGKKGSVAVFDYQLLEAATNNFHEDNMLAANGRGHIYKARLNEKSFAAVKKVAGHGQDAEKEFENEVNRLSKIRHQNIISISGLCIRGDTRLLVYEIMPKGSLKSQLYGVNSASVLTWSLRMKIAVDIARGLEYLHEHCNPPVVHRDLKSSSILLDSNFKAKLSDFGYSVTLGTQSKSVKLPENLVDVAPEYLLEGKLTDKSDVYAFGVILLELLIGKKSSMKDQTQFQSLVTWAMPQLTDRSKLPNIVDPAIKDSMDLKHLYQVAAVAVLCVQPEPSYRPLITDVLHSLIPLMPVEPGGSLRLT